MAVSVDQREAIEAPLKAFRASYPEAFQNTHFPRIDFDLDVLTLPASRLPNPSSPYGASVRVVGFKAGLLC